MQAKSQKKSGVGPAAPSSWSWNVVFVDCPASEAAVAAVQEELAGLGKALRGAAPKAIHLHVAITRSRQAGDHYVQSTLKLPHAIVHADESAAEIGEAVRAAFAALGEAARPALGEVSGGGPAPVMSFGEPLAAGEGPQSRREVVQELFANNYERLVRYARRRLRFYEQTGMLARREADPREMVDEAALRCLEEPLDALPRLDYLVWFHELVREQVQRCCREHRDSERRRSEFPQDGESEPEGDDLAAAVASSFEEDELLAEERVADAAGRTPEEAAEESDLVALVLEQAGSWPALEREVFVLHFVEGFTPAEVARLEKVDDSQVRETLDKVTARLRALFRDEPFFERS